MSPNDVSIIILFAPLIILAIAIMIIVFVNRGTTSKNKTNTTPNDENITLKKQFTVMVGGSARYMQRWDENYDKQLGYEWFKICTEYINFPDVNIIIRCVL